VVFAILFDVDLVGVQASGVTLVVIFDEDWIKPVDQFRGDAVVQGLVYCWWVTVRETIWRPSWILLFVLGSGHFAVSSRFEIRSDLLCSAQDTIMMKINVKDSVRRTTCLNG
jgi:hypothetical protein